MILTLLYIFDNSEVWIGRRSRKKKWVKLPCCCNYLAQYQSFDCNTNTCFKHCLQSKFCWHLFSREIVAIVEVILFNTTSRRAMESYKQLTFLSKPRYKYYKCHQLTFAIWRLNFDLRSTACKLVIVFYGIVSNFISRYFCWHSACLLHLNRSYDCNKSARLDDYIFKHLFPLLNWFNLCMAVVRQNRTIYFLFWTHPPPPSKNSRRVFTW